MSIEPGTRLDPNFIFRGDKADEAKNFACSLLERNGFPKNDITSIDSVDGGLVHHVFRLMVHNQQLYLKIRGNTFSKLSNISSNPNDIQYEKKTMDIFEKELPDMFPHVIAFYEHDHALLMTDVVSPGVSLEDLFNTSAVSEDVMSACGKAIAKMHDKMKTLPAIRSDNDNATYTNNLLYRLGYLHIPVLDSAVEDLTQMPKQLIFGDLSPKNIGIDENKVTFCDLELVHLGNAIFDIAFMSSHILLHSKNPEEGSHSLDAFLKAYLSEADVIINQSMLKILILGIALFRLDNPVIPYPLPLSEKTKEEKISGIRELLSRERRTWTDVIERVAYA